MPDKLRHIVNSVAPIRICDQGGWSDTWFARHGRVFNIAVYPYVQVQVAVYDRTDNRPRIIIHPENYGEAYAVSHPMEAFDKHPLLEAALQFMGIPEDVCIEVTIYSEAPGGCSTGTSAAVSVALIAALDRLTDGRKTPHEIALAAQRIETELLRQQCGIQDQIASAYGGINYIDMYEYPHASVSQLRIPDALWWELESRLALIYVGQTHSSSETHEMVIRNLEDAGADAPQLRPIRKSAEDSKNALYAGDFGALGHAMRECTEAQRALHPALVGPRHQQIIDIAAKCGAVGWKVNGAGGAGGSVTLLSGAGRRERRAMIREILAANSDYQEIRIFLSRMGVRTWQSRANGVALHSDA